MPKPTTSLVFITGSVLAATPAIFLGVNNGASLAGWLLMGFSGANILRGRA